MGTYLESPGKYKEYLAPYKAAIEYITRLGLTVFCDSKQTINIYNKNKIKIIVANLKNNRLLFTVKCPTYSFPSNMFILNEDYYILPKSIKEIDEYLSSRHYCRYSHKSEYHPPTSTDTSMILYKYPYTPYNIHLIKYNNNFTIVLEYNYNTFPIENSSIDITILTKVDRPTIMSDYICNSDFNIKNAEEIIVDIDNYINDLYKNTTYPNIQLHSTFSLSDINFKTSDLSPLEIEWRNKISTLGNN